MACIAIHIASKLGRQCAEPTLDRTTRRRKGDRHPPSRRLASPLYPPQSRVGLPAWFAVEVRILPRKRKRRRVRLPGQKRPGFTPFAAARAFPGRFPRRSRKHFHDRRPSPPTFARDVDRKFAAYTAKMAFSVPTTHNRPIHCQNGIFDTHNPQPTKGQRSKPIRQGFQGVSCSINYNLDDGYGKPTTRCRHDASCICSVCGKGAFVCNGSADSGVPFPAGSSR